MAEQDLFIVGAGPAGLACAITAATRGMRVQVVDAAPCGPIDKACGEGLLPDALASLARMGVQVQSGYPIRGIRFLAGRRTAEAPFACGLALGVRRTELHTAMLARAEDVGVTVEWGVPIRDLTGTEKQFVIGADGGQSRVRALARMEGQITTRRVGLRQHFHTAPWSDLVEVYWRDGMQAYVTPVSDHEVGVAFLSNRKLASMTEALSSFPDLRQHLAGAQPSSTARGALTVTRRLRRVTAERTALVGDASGAVDAITGEGLSLAFRQSEALVESLVADRLSDYENKHRQIMCIPRIMSAALLCIDRSSSVRHAAMRVLAGVPRAFNGLLRVHTGALAAILAIASLATAQSQPDPFTPYTACSVPNGPAVAETAPLAPGVTERTVQTRKGNATISLAGGRRIMFAYPGEDFYANIKVESILPGNYAQARATLIDNFEYTLASGDNARNYALKPILNGFSIQGLDRLKREGGVLGIYLLLDDATHTAVTIYFLNQEPPKRFKTMEQYATLRDRFLAAYTACIRDKQ